MSDASTRLLTLYVSLTSLVALPFLVNALPALPGVLTPSFLFFWFFTSVAEKWPVTMPLRNLGDQEGQAVAVSTAFYFAAIIVFGTDTAVLMAALAVCTGEILRGKSFMKTVFNVSQYIICTAVAGRAYELFAAPGPFLLAKDWPGLAAAAMVFMGLNVFFTLGAVSLSLGRSLIEIWQMTNKTVVVHDIALYPLGAMAAFIYQRETWAISLLFLPLLIIHYAFRTFSNLQVETRKVLEALADSIDMRDSYTYRHSKRVAQWTQGIGEAMGLQAEDTGLAVSAARIHDLGKVSWDNDILAKPGPLTPEEWEVVKRHPLIAVDMLKDLSLYREGVPLIRHHHERYDGQGYPDGLQGEEIPLGARIIAVADAYDAMTTDRPYRRACSPREALERLWEGAGTQFDPQVVEAFCQVWEAEERSLEPSGKLRLARQDETG